MNPPVLAFFSSRSGSGTTSLVYHLAHMLADCGYRVLAADLDPQGTLTEMCLGPDSLEQLWQPLPDAAAVRAACSLSTDPNPSLKCPPLNVLGPNLQLLPGNPALQLIEDQLAAAWCSCLDGNETAFRTTLTAHNLLQQAAAAQHAQIVLLDVAPSASALTRAAILAADSVVLPVRMDAFATSAFRYSGLLLHRWRKEWSDRLNKFPHTSHPQPPGASRIAGYVSIRQTEWTRSSAESAARRSAQIPAIWNEFAAGETTHSPAAIPVDPQSDPNCIAVIRPWTTLMQMAREARKPIFRLKPGDGALGSHMTAAQDAWAEYRQLAQKIVRPLALPD